MNSKVEVSWLISFVYGLLTIGNVNAETVTSTVFELKMKIPKHAGTGEKGLYSLLDPICNQLLVATDTMSNALKNKIIACKSKLLEEGNTVLRVYVETDAIHVSLDSTTECKQKVMKSTLSEWKAVVREHFKLGSNPIDLKQLPGQFDLQVMVFEGYLFDKGTGVYTWWSDWNEDYMREVKQFLQHAVKSGMQWPTLLSIRANPVHGFINLFAQIQLVFDPTLTHDTRGIPEQDAITEILDYFANAYDKPVKLASFHALKTRPNDDSTLFDGCESHLEIESVDSTWDEEKETAEDGSEVVEADVNENEHDTHDKQPDQLPESPKGSTIKSATVFEMALKLPVNDWAETLKEETQPYAVWDPICYHVILATQTIADGVLADKLLGCKSSHGTDGSTRLMVYVDTGLTDSKTDSGIQCIRDGWTILLEQWKLAVMEHFNQGANSVELRQLPTAPRVNVISINGLLERDNERLNSWWHSWSEEYEQGVKQFLLQFLTGDKENAQLLYIDTYPKRSFFYLYKNVHLMFDVSMSDQSHILKAEEVMRKLNAFATAYEKPIKLSEFHVGAISTNEALFPECIAHDNQEHLKSIADALKDATRMKK